MAAQMGHSEVVKVLLLRGADRDGDRKVNQLTNQDKETKLCEPILVTLQLC